MLQELTQLHNVFGGAAAVALPMPRVLTVHWPSSFLNKVVATISQKISRTPHSEAHAASNVFGLVPFCCRFAAISSQNMSIWILNLKGFVDVFYSLISESALRTGTSIFLAGTAADEGIVSFLRKYRENMQKIGFSQLNVQYYDLVPLIPSAKPLAALGLRPRVSLRFGLEKSRGNTQTSMHFKIVQKYPCSTFHQRPRQWSEQ